MEPQNASGAELRARNLIDAAHSRDPRKDEFGGPSRLVLAGIA